MRLERITDPSHPLYEEALALYRISFPLHEQRAARSQARILKDGDYHFTILRDGDTFVGLILFWEAGGFRYIEHFCIRPELRNRQYGQRALAMLAKDGIPLLLEIDPQVDALSRRREGFYERCGFAANPYPHIHPPYAPGNAGHPLVIMTYPEQISPADCAAFQAYLKNRVMAGAF